MIEAPTADAIRRGITTAQKARKEELWQQHSRHPDQQLVTVVCHLCNTRISARPDQVGAVIKCPECHVEIEVQPPKPKKEKSRPSVDGGYYRLHEGVDQPGALATDEVSVICSLCSTRLYARREQIGKRITCPDCQTDTLVSVPKKKRQRVATPDISQAYDIEPAEVLARPGNDADELISNAKSEATKAALLRPKPPKHPFIKGNIRFLFQLRIILLQLVLFVGIMIILSLIRPAMQMVNAGAGSMLSAFPIAALSTVMVAAAAILFVALTTVVSGCLLAIVEKTSACIDQIDEWPEFGIIDWLMQSFYFVGGIGISFVPGMLLGRLFDPSGSMNWPGLVTTFFFFPVLFLSMLESASVAGLFSRVIWSSLGNSIFGWFVFYVASALLGACVGLVYVLSSSAQLAWHQMLTVSVLAIAVVIYFRLLGRLGLVIGLAAERSEIAAHCESES